MPLTYFASAEVTRTKNSVDPKYDTTWVGEKIADAKARSELASWSEGSKRILVGPHHQENTSSTSKQKMEWNAIYDKNGRTAKNPSACCSTESMAKVWLSLHLINTEPS